MTAATLTVPPSRVRTAGWLCKAGALIGLAGGLLLIMVSPALAWSRKPGQITQPEPYASAEQAAGARP